MLYVYASRHVFASVINVCNFRALEKRKTSLVTLLYMVGGLSWSVTTCPITNGRIAIVNPSSVAAVMCLKSIFSHSLNFDSAAIIVSEICTGPRPNEIYLVLAFEDAVRLKELFLARRGQM